MTYSLCKALKEAGFPQTIPTHSPYERYSSDGKSVHQWQHHTGDPLEEFNDPDAVKIPSLEELIEACGDETWVKRKSSSSYWANQTGLETIAFIGLTPTEAVARLWLALNKK